MTPENTSDGSYYTGIVANLDKADKALSGYEQALTKDANLLSAINNIGLIKYEMGENG